MSPDDQLLVEPLQAHGFTVSAAAWDEDASHWEQFESIILRSTWNYQLHLEHFCAFLEQLETLHVPIWNPVSLVRWNVWKTYLRDLAQLGIPIIPTLWVDQGSVLPLAPLLKQRAWQDVVIKPIVGAAAAGVWRIQVEKAEDVQETFQALVHQTGLMIQPFQQEIQQEGEYSFVFLGGQYSHTVLKRPKREDFRVQSLYGGTCRRVEPAPTLVEQAREVYRVLPQPLLYARIDALVQTSQLVIMEVEITEPDLLLRFDSYAPWRFAQAFHDWFDERGEALC